MSPPEAILGIDIGTGSAKAVVYSLGGAALATDSVEYPLISTTPGMAELDARQVHAAVCSAIRNAVYRDHHTLLALSFSSAMHSLLAVDARGAPLGNCITWADNRATKWAEKIKRDFDGDAIYRRTGVPIHPMSPLAKLLWLRETQPELFARAARFVSIKEYVLHKLCGEWAADWSVASASGLLNLRNLDWDAGALDVAGITAQKLSPLVSTTHQLALSKSAATTLGLAAGLSVVAGATDGVLSNLGVNAIDPGVVAISIGTSGAIRSVVAAPETDTLGRTFCYALTDRHWVIGGSVNSGGIALRWVRDQLGDTEVAKAKRLGIDAYDVLTQLAASAPPGAAGLLFHPYLAGERAPLWDANARGSFFGLALHHRKEHLVRAVLEGVIFNLYSVFLALRDHMGEPARIHASGGFARSALWCQTMADIFQRPISIPKEGESACLGAAVLGLYALSRIDSLQQVASMVGMQHVHEPIAENARTYEKLLPIYLSLETKFRDEYREIAEFQRGG
jgi:gluconokinase